MRSSAQDPANDQQRFQFSLRGLLLCTLVAAIVLALLGNAITRTRRDDLLRSQMHEQHFETERVLRAWMASGRPFSNSWTSYSASPEKWQMSAGIANERGSESPFFLNLNVSGHIRDGKLGPIEIQDVGAEKNGEIISQLVKAYTANGWESEVRRVTEANENP